MNRNEKNRLVGSMIGTFLGLTIIDWDNNDFNHATSWEVLGKNLFFALAVPSIAQSGISLLKKSSN